MADQKLLAKLAEFLQKHGFDMSREKYRSMEDKPASTRKIENEFGGWARAKELAQELSEFGELKEIEKSYSDDEAVVTTKSLGIRTLSEALEEAEVDQDVWEVDRHVVNSWEVTVGKKNSGTGKPETFTNYQVKVWLKRREINFKKMSEEIVERMKKHAPTYKKIVYPKLDKRYMVELDLFDLHYGKHAWRKETGEDYDIKIAQRDAIDSLYDLLAKTQSFRPEKFLLPIGNDLLQIDTLSGKTTQGTPVDVDDRATKIFNNVLYLCVAMIDKLRTIAPVDVLMIPGNHDRQSIFHLGTALQAWYRNCEEVFVENEPRYRKYYRYGTNLIGFVHGGRSDPKMDKLPLIMASERPDDWAETKHREWHLGHVHKAKEFKYNSGNSYRGVRVRVIPSLTGTDQWHFEHGFVKERKSAEACVWDYDEGCIGIFTSFAKEYPDEVMI